MNRLYGRYILVGNKVTLFNPNDFKPGQAIQLRTPIYCESKKICHTCYGELIKRIKSPYVGVIAGASIGERGTQLIMRTFHTGGAATLAQHDILQEIIDNDPLANLEK
jgi:UDP-N-acetylglucosamine enolpyruvyl transferase